MKTLLLVGATGMVGREVLRLALADQRVSRVVAPTRRALPAHEKLDNPVVDFDKLPIDADWWRADSVICTLGTTMRKAGTRQAFRKVDHDYPLLVGVLARRQGAEAYVLNSAMGADPHSWFIYSKVKGEVERELVGCGYPSFTVVRPGLLGGVRDEFRPGEAIAMKLVRLLGPLVPRRYRVVPAESVAQVLLDAAVKAEEGLRIVESEKIRREVD